MMTIECIFTDKKGSITYLGNVIPRIGETIIFAGDSFRVVDVIHYVSEKEKVSLIVEKGINMISLLV